jgi:hypothetical protein
MSAMPAGPGRSTETPRDTATPESARHGRLRAAAAHGVPLAGTGRGHRDGEQEPIKAELKAPTFDLSGGRCA